MPELYTRWIMAGKRARDVPATTYLRDRESARTLLVICGPYQMRPRSFHRRSTYRTVRSVSPARFFDASRPPPPRRRYLAVLRQKSFRSSLLLRRSRIMYPQADPFSIGGLTQPRREILVQTHRERLDLEGWHEQRDRNIDFPLRRLVN